MVAAFATYTELGVLLKRTFVGDDIPWATALLEQAADIMRGVMRTQVYPAQTIEYVAYPVAGRVTIAAPFLVSIDSVERGGEEIEYEVEGYDLITVDCDDPITLTVTCGLSAAPGDLKAINCALVSGAILTVEAGLGLTAGGMSSVAIDDFKAVWADAGQMSGMALTPYNVKYLEDRYGTTAWVVEMTR